MFAWPHSQIHVFSPKGHQHDQTTSILILNGKLTLHIYTTLFIPIFEWHLCTIRIGCALRAFVRSFKIYDYHPLDVFHFIFLISDRNSLLIKINHIFKVWRAFANLYAYVSSSLSLSWFGPGNAHLLYPNAMLHAFSQS